MTTLYKKDNKGIMRVWAITPTDTGFLIEHGALGGVMQQKHEEVPRGKVKRTREEQIQLQIASRVKKNKDKGYSETQSEALNAPTTNALGLAMPMLAQTYSKKSLNQKDFDAGVFVQRKYDGNRCIIHHHHATGIMAYSRNGQPITSIDHILHNLNIPVGTSIDGELYAHGYRLQEIVSWIKRKQMDSAKLKYHAYDVIEDKPFRERFSKLCTITGNIEIAPTWSVFNEDAIYGHHEDFRKDGYEGTIIRLNDTGYEDGKRSRSLLKMKDWHDAEFVVLDVVPSKEGWGRLCCATSGGNQFRVTAPGTVPEKMEVLENRFDYIGRRVTIEYAYLTSDGIPFHPIAKCWR